MKPISNKRKRHLLLLFTALVVAYVRNVIQYGSYSWDSLLDFFAFWVVHYFAVAIVGLIGILIIKSWEQFFLGYKEGEGLTLEDGLVYCCMFILASAVFIFFMAHWSVPFGDLSDGY